jgi:hypothetical protein
MSESNSRTIEISFWMKENGTIHVTSKEPGFNHIAVCDKPDSAFGHRQLHKRLKAILRKELA